MYKKISGSKGDRYLKDGKMVAKKNVPPEILESLEDNEKVKACIFCSKPATHQRFVLLQVVDLCEEDFYSKRMGQVAQQVRELQNA